MLELLSDSDAVGLGASKGQLELLRLVLVALELARELLLLGETKADVGLLVKQVEVVLPKELELPERLAVLALGDRLLELALQLMLWRCS